MPEIFVPEDQTQFKAPELENANPKEKYIQANKDLPGFDAEEFGLHQLRFEQKAAEFNKKRRESLLGRTLHGDEEPATSESIAWQEAIADNAQWNKMYHLELQENGEFRKEMNAEFKEWHKMLETVLANLKKKRDDPEGEGKEIRPLLFALGGGMAGSYGAGQVSVLAHKDYMAAFNYAVGISAGACDIEYALGGKQNVLLGTSMYYEECGGKDFIDYNRPSQVMNVGYLADIMHNDPKKKVDIQAVQDQPTEFFVQATNRETKQPEFIDAKHNDKGIVEAVHASMALPFVYRKTVRINDTDYVDGAFSESFDIEKVIEKFHPTDILVLPNCPFDNMAGVQNEARLWNAIAMLVPDAASLKSGSLVLGKKFLKGKEGFRKGLEHIQAQSGVRIGIMYPPNCGLMPVTQDSKEIKAAVLASARSACEDLGETMDIKFL